MIDFLYKSLRVVGIKTHRSFRLSLRALTLIVGLCAAYQLSILLEKNEFDAALKLFWLVLATAFVEFVLADVLADRSFPFDTERKLALMEKRLGAQAISTIEQRLKHVIEEFQCCEQHLVSATVHVTVELSSTADQRVRQGLLQLTEYVGPGGGRKGRITLINQGVIGRCGRTGRLETAGFADKQDYAEAMVREFGFTSSEAKSHTDTARSYLAFPLHHRSRVVGVLYFFTPEPQVFPLAAKISHLKRTAEEIVNYMKLADLV
jgi:hypothetical protein